MQPVNAPAQWKQESILVISRSYWHWPIDEMAVKEKNNSYAYPLQIIYKQFKVK